MTVSIEHRGERVAVVRGLDTTESINHLCHSLAAGCGVDAQIVVVDLSGSGQLFEKTRRVLADTSTEMLRSHRWLGIVAVAGHHESDEPRESMVYDSARAAAAAGAQYLELVHGTRRGRPAAREVVSAAVGLVAPLQEVGVDFLARLAVVVRDRVFLRWWR